MADRYQQLIESPPGRLLAGQLGLPKPSRLRRYEPGQPVVEGEALVNGAPGGRLVKPVTDILKAAKVKTV